METLEAKHGVYLRVASTVFRIAAVAYGIVGVISLCALLSLSGFMTGPVGIIIFVLALLQVAFIVFLLDTAGRIMEFLVDLAIVADDTWKRVEDTRRTIRRQEEKGS